MQNLYCRNLLNVKFPKIVAEKFAFYTKSTILGFNDYGNIILS